MFFNELTWDNVYLLAAVLAGFPAAWAQNKLAERYHNIRHVFGIVVSSGLYLAAIGKPNFVDVVVTAPLYTFFMIQCGVRPWFIVTALYGHLGYLQLQETAVHTAPFMMTVVRLVRFTWHCHESGKVPSFLEFYGYIMQIGGFFTGPTNDFSDYISIDNQMTRDTSGATKKDECGEDDNDERRYSALFIQSAILVPLFALTAPYTFHQVKSLDWKGQSMWMKLLPLPVYAAHAKIKYYFIWKMAEGVCRMTGLPKRASINVSIRDIEFAESFYAIVRHWNMTTADYLRRFIYKRLKETINSTAGATLLTFALSGYWHGFYGGYYLSFSSAALLTVAARIIRRRVRPMVTKYSSTGVKVAYNVIGWALTQYFVAYMMAPFVLLETSVSLQFWADTNYLCHKACVGVILCDIFWSRQVQYCKPGLNG